MTDTISLSLAGGLFEGKNLVHASIGTPIGSKPIPHDICCVVDVSGSMGSAAPAPNDDPETKGFSVLDIVKHAIKTIINIMKPEDRLSLVTFESSPHVIFEFEEMTTEGKAKAEAAVSALYPDGGTNLWDGLKTGLDMIKSSNRADRFKSLLLLTDGEPTDSNHEALLKEYQRSNKLNCSINTFGFGYRLNSSLLNTLADMGNGSYSFIPDSGFVGTIFVNSVSNLLTTVATAELDIEVLNGASLDANGFKPYKLDSNAKTTIELGSLQYGQSKDVVFEVKLPKEVLDHAVVRATLRYKGVEGSSSITRDLVQFGQCSADLIANYYRLQAVQRIKEAMEASFPNASSHIGKLITEVNKHKKDIKQLEELAKDLEGQVSEAFSRADWYNKWGCHYLPSLIGAHRHQMCNNFKDFGVQVYGGSLFKQIRDAAEDVFVKLPPPTPSLSGSSDSAPSNMSSYYCATGGCFAGECLVQLADGSQKLVREVKKGDLVKSSSGASAEVVSVVKLGIEGIADLVELPNGLVLTPYHPVYFSGKWQFPLTVGKLVHREIDAVYDFVLSAEHNVIVNGYTCVTLGHNYQEDVVKHSYFGSDLIIKDLQKSTGWSDGLVSLESGCFVRDKDTNLIVGINVNPQVNL